MCSITVKNFWEKIPVWLRCALIPSMFYLSMLTLIAVLFLLMSFLGGLFQLLAPIFSILIVLLFIPYVIVLLMSSIAVGFLGLLLPGSLVEKLWSDPGYFGSVPTTSGLLLAFFFWFLLGLIFGILKQLFLKKNNKI